jgi:hypothetical protein
VVFVHNQFPDFSFQFADVLIATSKRILRVALENVYFEFWHFAFAPQTRTMSDAIRERAAIWTVTAFERARDAHELWLPQERLLVQ